MTLDVKKLHVTKISINILSEKLLVMVNKKLLRQNINTNFSEVDLK